MGYISPQGEQSTASEIACLTALNNLGITPSGFALVKTGKNPSSWGTVALPSSGGGSSGITIGTTTITGGTNTNILYNNSGKVGEYTVSGTGTVVALTTSPTFTTPTLGAATCTTLNGLTITTSTGTLTITNLKTLTISNSLTLAGTDGKSLTLTNGLTVTTNDGTIAFGAASKTLTVNNSITVDGTSGKNITLTNSLTVSGNDGTLSFGAASKTLSVNNSLTFAGTDSTTITFGANNLSFVNSGAFTLTIPATGTVDLLGTAQTFTAAKTFTTGLLKVADVADSNANLSLAITATASAVDYFTVINAATANPATVKFQATGSDSNINALFSPKGTGKIQLTDGTDTTKILAIDLSGATTGKTATFALPVTNNRTITFPDAAITVARSDAAQTFTGNQTFTNDVLTVTYTDYSGSTTVSGFSATGTLFVAYKKVGSLVWVWFRISGTSNSTSFSFTVPYNNDGIDTVFASFTSRDNGSFFTGADLQFPTGAATVNLYKDGSQAAWTNTGTKSGWGQFVYKTNS